MKKRILLTLTAAALFFICLFVSVEKDAQTVRDSVFRFHVIANSDSAADQSNKLAVRDGISELCSSLFSKCDSKEQSMAVADSSLEKIEAKATEVLRLRGDDSTVCAAVTKRWFPTRCYDGVTLPAGVYDTLDIKIGKAEGQNFWCVMFPDICLNASTAAANKQKMSSVLSGGSLRLTTGNVKFKFKIVEIFQKAKRKLCR